MTEFDFVKSASMSFSYPHCSVLYIMNDYQSLSEYSCSVIINRRCVLLKTVIFYRSPVWYLGRVQLKKVGYIVYRFDWNHYVSASDATGSWFNAWFCTKILIFAYNMVHCKLNSVKTQTRHKFYGKVVYMRWIPQS